MSTKGIITILSLELQTEKSPQKYKGNLCIDGANYAVTFSPRLKGDISGSHIATFSETAISTHGISMNKTLPQATLAGALEKGTSIDVDLTPKGSVGTPRAPRAPRKSSVPTSVSWARFYVENDSVILEAGVDSMSHRTDLGPADLEIVKHFEMVLKAREYFRTHASKFDRASLDRDLAFIETLGLEDAVKSAVILRTRAKYAIPTIAEAAKLQLEIEAEANKVKIQ